MMMMMMMMMMITLKMSTHTERKKKSILFLPFSFITHVHYDKNIARNTAVQCVVQMYTVLYSYRNGWLLT